MAQAATSDVSLLTQDSGDNVEKLISRIGQLTRTLHESMRELGLHKEVLKAAEAIPDTRDRLSYVATMTERAAERALNAVDVAQPIQESIAKQAKNLEQRWNAWFAEPVELNDARSLVMDTRSYLQDVPIQASAINAQLVEIMMAQDFQDLTGQVIKKMMEVVQQMEKQLLQVLIDNTPTDKLTDVGQLSGEVSDAADSHSVDLLHGPNYKQVLDSNSLSDQGQVDDLLASLGF
ncbi:protein phosphatase CheZ [Glaciimonas soli]|uniref:Protein phosphatase CheZ n=1 Tax=Glaciimonas soli TaxID=2590999 RepID=A0A843YNW9_9BURK|nr:protein phosphatase CheZ [Glaciimonas soli]MQQ99473.1 protein phosphatase CheZ [Glaciimonas soli]